MATSDRPFARRSGTTSPIQPWAAVGAYGLLLLSTQVLWLTYAPVTANASSDFGVSEGAVGDLAVVVPILYVALGLQAGRWLDRRFTTTMAVGTALIAVGAAVRAFDCDNYAFALIGQLILAAGQPLILNAITKLPARFFPPEQRVRAISFLTAAQVFGILVASSTGPWFYSHGGLPLLVQVHAAVAVVAGGGMLLALTVKPRHINFENSPSRISLRNNRQMWLLAGQVFIGLGLFNALATWLDTLQTGLGNPGLGGPMVTVMTVAGIVGTVVIPSLAARYGQRRLTLISIGLGCTAATPMLLVIGEPIASLGIIAFIGLLLISGLPIVLDWSETLVGREHAGTAAAFILVIANLGGSLYVVIVQGFISAPRAAILVLTLLVLPWPVIARLQAPDAIAVSASTK